MRNILCVYVDVIKIDIEVQASPSDRLTFITPSVSFTFLVCFPFSINLYLARYPHSFNHARRIQWPWQSNHHIQCIFSFDLFIYFSKISSICFHWPWSWFYLAKCQNHYTDIWPTDEELEHAQLYCIRWDMRIDRQNSNKSDARNIDWSVLSFRLASICYRFVHIDTILMVKMNLSYVHHTDSSKRQPTHQWFRQNKSQVIKTHFLLLLKIDWWCLFLLRVDALVQQLCAVQVASAQNLIADQLPSYEHTEIYSLVRWQMRYSFIFDCFAINFCFVLCCCLRFSHRSAIRLNAKLHY